MNERVKRLWLKALRSGEYKRGTAYLKNGNRFCCLGVLCDLYLKEHPEAEWSRLDGCNSSCISTDEDTHNAVLPVIVREWAGMNTLKGWYTTKKGSQCLATINDRADPKDDTFNCVVHRIKRHWKQL